MSESIHAAKDYKKRKSTIAIDGSRSKNKDIVYVDNAKFFEAVVLHLEACKEADLTGAPHPKLSNYIGECLLKIATKVAGMRHFMYYTYNDEMILDAIENCIHYFNNFNPEVSKNPFAYFTQIVYYAFIRRIEIEKKQSYVKYKGIVDALATHSSMTDDGESAEMLDHASENMEIDVSHMQEFIFKFEEKNKLKNKGTRGKKKAAG